MASYTPKSKPKGPAFLIRIIYKSGYVQDGWYESFSFNTNLGGLKKIEWTICPGHFKPLIIGVEEIAAVYQLDAIS